ncbi:abscisic acid responsive elements-binding factor 3 [Actinidia rufa]|uniref:Abscisic acid responsive elements-binding factor 3 n=1 Tax=Actinidia rufa TaxID=165716 RepID=A0A7J0ESY4_9ERIC|nr:abscisic acid responsive elements-binding factor 3 [Actinidia rufa]
MKPVGNFPLARQSSVYSLTFDEFQNSWGGLGKDFGSMNMDELLKNIWTAEETQAMASSSGAHEGGALGGNLQRQGSLTWGGSSGSHLQQRQPTLGEMTLEEFLSRAGVVRELDTQPMTRPSNNGFYGELPQPNNNTPGLTLGFQQLACNNVVVGNRIPENNNLVPNQSSGLPVNVNGVRSSQQQLLHPSFPKQNTLSFASSMPLANNTHLANPGTRGPVVRIEDPSINVALDQGTVIQNGVVGMTGLGTGTTVLAAGSPVSRSSDGIAKNNVDTSSLSPSPCAFNGDVRGRKSGGTWEKAMERRHRRMIKNRESAARSRARKQAYTLELEAEIAELKKINEELQRKQEEIMEMRKNQVHAPFTVGCLRLHPLWIIWVWAVWPGNVEHLGDDEYALGKQKAMLEKDADKPLWMTKEFAHNSQGQIGCVGKSPACDQFAVDNYSGAIHCFVAPAPPRPRARRRTLTIITASISSVPKPIGTRTCAHKTPQLNPTKSLPDRLAEGTGKVAMVMEAWGKGDDSGGGIGVVKQRRRRRLPAWCGF